MVRVFKTDVQNSKKANQVLVHLSKEYPAHEINFDLEDCDNILRIEGNDLGAEEIVKYMERMGCFCTELYG